MQAYILGTLSRVPQTGYLACRISAWFIPRTTSTKGVLCIREFSVEDSSPLCAGPQRATCTLGFIREGPKKRRQGFQNWNLASVVLDLQGLQENMVIRQSHELPVQCEPSSLATVCTTPSYAGQV